MEKISLKSLKQFRLKWLGGTWHILGFTLLPLLAAIAIVFYILNIETTFQPPLLFPVLSTIFSTGSGLIIAFFAIRTYISTSTWRVLFLGGGALAFGISSLVAGWLLPAGLNVAATVSNFGVLLGATLHFLGAIQKPASDLTSNPTRKLSNRTITILFCSALSAFFILVYVATSAGLFPAFFVPGLGYTLIRYIFSAIYLVLIVISAVVYARLYLLFKTKFIYWYSLGLAIFALGLLAGFLGIPGSPLNWVGRIAQYIGSIYFVVAVVITQNEARNKQMGVSELIAQHLNRSKANYELLVEAASDAIIAVDGLERILMWNPAAEFMFGYDRSEAIGKPLFDLISNPEQVDAYGRAADKASPGKDDLGTTPVIELKARRRNGEEFPIELTLVSRKRMAEWLPTTTLIIRDITERKRAEEALKESEQRYATTLASIGDAVISTDTEGRVIFMNAEAEALTGWTLAEASTKSVTAVFNIINENTRREVDNPVTRVLKEGIIVGLANHTILVRKDGAEVPIDDSGAPIRDRDGKTMGVVLVFRDITERKQAEEALRSAEAKFRILVEQSLVGTYITQDKKIIYVNPKLAEILGYTQDEIISSKSVSDLIVEEDSDRAIENIRKRLKGEVQSIQQTFKGKRKDGILVDLEVHGTRTELDGKTVVIGTALDITERKQLESKLKDAAEKYSTIFDTTSDGVWIHNLEGQILEVNDAYCRMSGYTRDEIIGMPISKLEAIETPEDITNHIKKVIEAGGHDRFESQHRRKDGSIFDVDITALYLDREGGRIAIFTRDITERKRAEEALAHSSRRISEILESITDGFMAIDNDWCFTYVNQRAAGNLGLKHEDLIGQNIWEKFPAIKDTDHEIYYRKAMQQHEPQHFEMHGVLTDKWYEIRVYPSAEGVSVFWQDTTERKRVEKALQESEQKYRELIKYAPAAIYEVDFRNQKFISVNDAMCQMLGYTREELLVTNPFDLLDDRSKLIFQERITKWLSGETPDTNVEYTGKTKDGREIYVILNVTFTSDANGQPIGATVIGYDITERKRAEEMLRKAHDELELRVQERTAELKEANKALMESEASYRELTESIDDLFFAMDGELRFTYWNKVSETLTGILEKDAIGKSLFELFPDIKGTKVEQFYIEALKTQQPQRFENEYKLGGKKFVFEVSAYPTKDGLSVIAKDITEKKMLEAQLLRAQRMESIGTLAGGIAHDLNNMLTPIMMSLQMFKEKYKDEQSQRLLDILEQNSQRSADLIKQVLSFARGVEGERNPLAVKHIINEIEKISKETFPRNIEIRTDIPKDLYTILGDATQLHQVIMNLCVNARDAMPDGGILNISSKNFFIDENYSHMHTEAKIGSYIIIEVSDTGTGIPPKILDRIFEPFFTTKEFGKGTGLGLSTVLAIVKSHGGFINVNSEVGEGTTFGVYLPAIKTEIQSVDEKQPELLIGHGELVLVAEDEDSVREVTISTLEKNGYRVLTASDGVEAISSYAQNMEEIKIILMDMMMPVMDGQASIRAIRRINPEVKIIAVSGLAEKEKLKNVSDSTNAFLPKPYTAEKLLKAVHEVLSAK